MLNISLMYVYHTAMFPRACVQQLLAIKLQICWDVCLQPVLYCSSYANYLMHHLEPFLPMLAFGNPPAALATDLCIAKVAAAAIAAGVAGEADEAAGMDDEADEASDADGVVAADTSDACCASFKWLRSSPSPAGLSAAASAGWACASCVTCEACADGCSAWAC